WHCQRRIRRGAEHDTRHWLICQQAVTSSDRCFAVLKWIPADPNARLNVLVVLMVDVGYITPDSQQRSTRRIEDYETVIALAGSHIPVVANSQFERKIRPQLEIVLQQKANGACGHAARLTAEGHSGRSCC